jgi:flagellar motility protein MotE (MotC chaperone)
MKKYHILILISAGLLSFGASFGVSWFIKQKNATAAIASQVEAATSLPAEAAGNPATKTPPWSGATASETNVPSMGISERQLQHLIYDIREKIADYNAREKELDQEASRIAIARQSLQEDIDRLNMLREKLDLSLAALKEKEESIRKTVLEIESIEKANFQRLALTYEKMDSVQAGKIMLSMAANNQLQDAVKILYYMNDRYAGKLLGEIGSTQPDIAGVLSLQLKRVREGE